MKQGCNAPNLFMNNSLLIPIKESTEKDNNEHKSVLTRKKKGDCQRIMLLHRLLHSMQSMGHSTLIAQAFTLSAEHGSLNTYCTGFYTQCGAWVTQCSLHRLLHSVRSMGRSTLVAQAFTLSAEHGLLNTHAQAFTLNAEHG